MGLNPRRWREWGVWMREADINRARGRNGSAAAFAKWAREAIRGAK
jgi:hypothetical protein